MWPDGTTGPKELEVIWFPEVEGREYAYAQSESVPVIPLALLEQVEEELRREAAKTPIPSPPLAEGTANGLELAAEKLRSMRQEANDG